MELSNEFTVEVPVDEAWRVITDLERIAPCMPGAQLQEVDGDDYKGVVKIKLGPITAQYKGVARFVERDDDAHRAVLRAEGRDTRGQGNASADITANLVAAGPTSTRVTVQTDLTITGKVAQFGRGVLGDVSAKLIDQFAESLNTELTSGSSAAEAAPTVAANGDSATADGGAPAAAPATAAASAPATETAATTGPRLVDSQPAAPIDLFGSAGSPIAKRLVPVVAVVVVLWLLRRLTKRK